MNIDKRLQEIIKEHNLIMKRKEELEEEYNSYFYIINLCNSSDHYKEFLEDNPDWEFRSYVTLKGKEGYLKNVIIEIPKHKISRENFIKEAKKIVSPDVGDYDFVKFERKNK